jgi:hypothetical protein
VNLIKSAVLTSEIRGPTILLSTSFYLCNVCHAIFGNKAELNRHILTHTGSAKGGGEGMYSERSAKRVTLVVDAGVKAITATAFIHLPLAHWWGGTTTTSPMEAFHPSIPTF